MDMILRNDAYTVPQYREELTYKDLEMDPYKRVCRLNGERVALTPTEFSILQVLLENRGRAVSAQELAELVWNDAFYISRSDSLAVHIRHLREKLDDTLKPFSYVKTAWGVGYAI